MHALFQGSGSYTAASPDEVAQQVPASAVVRIQNGKALQQPKKKGIDKGGRGQRLAARRAEAAECGAAVTACFCSASCSSCQRAGS